MCEKDESKKKKLVTVDVHASIGKVVLGWGRGGVERRSKRRQEDGARVPSRIKTAVVLSMF
jgi:hypothetical protein